MRPVLGAIAIGAGLAAMAGCGDEDEKTASRSSQACTKADGSGDVIASFEVEKDAAGVFVGQYTLARDADTGFLVEAAGATTARIRVPLGTRTASVIHEDPLKPDQPLAAGEHSVTLRAFEPGQLNAGVEPIDTSTRCITVGQ